MDGLKLWVALLLCSISCVETKGACSETRHVKITGKGPHSAPVCTNWTEGIITFAKCNLTDGSAHCDLLYDAGKAESGRCGGFGLEMENQTLSLHLSRLTPEDRGGNYTCECSRTDGTFHLCLNVTVEGIEIDSSSSGVVVSVSSFLVIYAVALGLICRVTRNRRPQEAGPSPPDAEAGDIEPYSTFMQTENGLYCVSQISRNPPVPTGN